MNFRMRLKNNIRHVERNKIIKIKFYHTATYYIYDEKRWMLFIGTFHLKNLLREFFKEEYYRNVISEFGTEEPDMKHPISFNEAYQKVYERIGEYYKDEI